MSDMFGLAGKGVLITGAGRGIGASIAREFAAQGARLVLAARSREELEGVAKEIEAADGTAHVVPTDLADNAQVQALADKASELLGGVDILVSNAAASPAPASLLDTPLETFKQTYEVNTFAALILVKALAPKMEGRANANIVIVSSIRGLGGTPFGSPYGSSKAALNQLIRTIACELGPIGIRINGILPGPVETAMTTGYFDGNRKLFDYYADVAPIKGWTQPEDMVGPALFLASPGARKVTGHLLVVDGGLSATNQDAFAPPPHLMEG